MPNSPVCNHLLISVIFPIDALAPKKKKKCFTWGFDKFSGFVVPGMVAPSVVTVLLSKSL